MRCTPGGVAASVPAGPAARRDERGVRRARALVGHERLRSRARRRSSARPVASPPPAARAMRGRARVAAPHPLAVADARVERRSPRATSIDLEARSRVLSRLALARRLGPYARAVRRRPTRGRAARPRAPRRGRAKGGPAPSSRSAIQRPLLVLHPALPVRRACSTTATRPAAFELPVGRPLLGRVEVRVRARALAADEEVLAQQPVGARRDGIGRRSGSSGQRGPPSSEHVHASGPTSHQRPEQPRRASRRRAGSVAPGAVTPAPPLARFGPAKRTMSPAPLPPPDRARPTAPTPAAGRRPRSTHGGSGTSARATPRRQRRRRGPPRRIARHDAPSWRSASAGCGRRSLKVAPRARVCTVIVPPCSSAIFLTMARPRPVPPFLPLVTNDWKRRCSISLGMPGPVSEKRHDERLVRPCRASP